MMDRRERTLQDFSLLSWLKIKRDRLLNVGECILNIFALANAAGKRRDKYSVSSLIARFEHHL